MPVLLVPDHASSSRPELRAPNGDHAPAIGGGLGGLGGRRVHRGPRERRPAREAPGRAGDAAHSLLDPRARGDHLAQLSFNLLIGNCYRRFIGFLRRFGVLTEPVFDKGPAYLRQARQKFHHIVRR